MVSWGIIAVDDAGRRHRDCQVDVRSALRQVWDLSVGNSSTHPARLAHHSQLLEGTWKALGRHLKVAMRCDEHSGSQIQGPTGGGPANPLPDGELGVGSTHRRSGTQTCLQHSENTLQKQILARSSSQVRDEPLRALRSASGQRSGNSSLSGGLGS